MCSTYPTYKDLPADCTAEQGYQFADPTTSPDLNLGTFKNWYASADYTPDGGAAASTDPDAAIPYVAFARVTEDSIPDGGWCGATTAAVLRASHNNDWGCLFGPWDFGTNPADASGWDGIAFWARAPGQTTKGFTLAIGDNNTESGASGSHCRDYIVDGGASTPTSGGPVGTIDPSTGTPLSGSGTSRAPFADECGNGYTVAMQVTSAWRFYAVPFSKFQQTSSPNRVPNSVFDAGTVPGTGLDKAALRHLVLRFAKESEVELWISKIAFYKKKG